MAKRTNRSGSLEKHGGYWLVRWMVDDKRYTRSTGCMVSGGYASVNALRKALYYHAKELGITQFAKRIIGKSSPNPESVKART